MDQAIDTHLIALPGRAPFYAQAPMSPACEPASAIPAWVRREAARAPFGLLWYSLGFGYNGDTLYIRLIGIGKNGTPGVAPRQLREIRQKRSRFYIRKRRARWQVHDRTKHRTGGSLVASAKTRRAARKLMNAIKKKTAAADNHKTYKKRKRKPRAAASIEQRADHQDTDHVCKRQRPRHDELADIAIRR